MISVVLAVSLMLTKCRVAESKKYYAVYYDPADYDGFNPKGYGYEPVGPDEWNKVVCIFIFFLRDTIFQLYFIHKVVCEYFRTISEIFSIGVQRECIWASLQKNV